MATIVDSVAPDPVVIPRGGTVQVLVTAHEESTPDDPGTIEVRFVPQDGSPPVVLTTLQALVDSPTDPPPAVPWPDIALVPIDLGGVSVVNNGGGSYTVRHTG